MKTVNISLKSSSGDEISVRFKCLKCNKILSSEQNLKNHTALHGIGSQFEICGACYKEISNLPEK